jgi:hypothetical protein
MQVIPAIQAIALKILRLCSKLAAGLVQGLGQAKLLGMLVAIAFCLGACNSNNSELNANAKNNLSPVTTAQSPKITISEVSPPPAIQKLSRYFDAYEPRIKILEPKSDQILTDTKVAIEFEVKDLPIFKNPDLGLGTHVHVILDNQEYKALYDLAQPLVFENLAVGTHTIRAFASRPWHESFKNEGAFAQTTFHVYTKTGENTPNPQLPMLTYSRPVGVYGAEPIMLDFYLKNTPLHAALLEEAQTNDWQIRVTVNDQSFKVDQWLPVYIKGLNVGLNWVKLEFLDSEGHLVANQFNSTAHLINYQPNGTDTLSRLVRGETISGIEGIVNPNYVPESNPVQETKKAEPAPKLKSQPKPPTEKDREKEFTPKIDPQPLKPETESKDRVKPEPITTTPVLPTLIEPIAPPLIDILPDRNDIKTPEAPDEAVTNQKSDRPPEPIVPQSESLPIAEPAIKTFIPPSDPASEESPKIMKGLENLNLGERLKQARQKKAEVENADANKTELKVD